MVVVAEDQVRVDSVRKTREEYLRERMKERNLSDLFVDLKIRASRDDHYSDLKKATIQAIRRRIKQAPIAEETFANVSFGPVQVSMERWQGSIGYHSPMGVVKHFTRAPDSELEQYGIKAIINGGLDGFTEGYGSLRHDIPPKKHKRKYGWKPDFYTMIDIPTLLAEVLFTNALIRFAIENVDLIIREFAKAAIEYVRCHRVEESQVSVPSLSWLPLMEQMERQCPNITVPQGEKDIHLDQKIPASLWEALLNQDESTLLKTIRELGYQARDVLFQAALFPLLHEVQFLQDDADDREELESTHARVWQLKRNIPKKVIARMEQNAFLSHYGVVELDADVDLDKFTDIEKEFRRVLRIVPIPKCPEYSFRIRKLGNYRAAGLHFPFHKATLVDLDGISSFLHEVGHQMDGVLSNRSGKLSEQYAFREAYELYCNSVLSAIRKLPSDDPFLLQWKGKSKYNSNYYLRPTEVFARSFELFLYEVEGIRSSFLHHTYSDVVYPKNDTYLQAVNEYFRNLLGSMPIVPDEPARSAEQLSSTPLMEFYIDSATSQIVFPI